VAHDTGRDDVAPDPRTFVGRMVRAIEVVGADSERPPRVLTGRLQVVYVKALDYDRYSVVGIGVDPSSIELIGEQLDPRNGGTA
jgi:hypothetical protein